jgi:hypothetical protein
VSDGIQEKIDDIEAANGVNAFPTVIEIKDLLAS